MTGTRARQAVHAASGNPLGAADPRQEGPADLRLVVPAAAAWVAAAVAVGVPGRWTAAAVTVCLVAAALLLTPVAVRRVRTGREVNTAARSGSEARTVRRVRAGGGARPS
ncbi:hypothetical protein GTW66_25225 [Streptomyces sp. SID5473]|uniref:hypothetical protein n=1 Tax=Streptomyces sp. SID5473 TaxID=2690299 RepID=UPI00025CDD83|nr:hypothetical protein [Streptomyces sp. SID5473]EIF89672.1 ComEC/Rec2 related protein [Streptomyces tsukubensis NRRL18488]MYS67192.1 hypothetical protein [Streptomyces sp. SID5473]